MRCTLEGIYSILNGTAKGIHYQDRYYALDGYLGELGDGFLDGGRSPSQDLKLEGHNPINLGSRDLLAANGEQGDEFATLYTMANNFLGLNTAMSWVEAFGGEELLNLGIYRHQLGNEPNPSTDPITSLFIYNEDGTKTILWSNPDYTPPGDEQVKNKHIPNGRNVVSGDERGLNFHASASGDVTLGVNVSGSLKNGVGIIANVGSSVLAEGEVSTSNSSNIQGAVNGDLKIKQEFGLAYIVGLSYKHKFIDRQGKILNETHSATLGVLGVLGTTFEWDSSGTLQNIYFGVDVSGNIGVGIGASGSLKLGWLYNFND